MHSADADVPLGHRLERQRLERRISRTRVVLRALEDRSVIRSTDGQVPAERPLPGGLTPRETEVLRLVALGHTNLEIGELLHVSQRTVETHRARLQAKANLSTRAELVHFALEHGLLGTPTAV